MKLSLFIFLLSNAIFLVATQNKNYNEKITEKFREERIKTFSNNKSSLPPNQRAPMTINSNLLIKDTLSSNEITTNKLNASGNVRILSSTKLSNLSTNQVTVNKLFLEKINPENGVLTVNGNVIIANEHPSTHKQLSDSFTSKRIKEWSMKYHDDFQSDASLEGWNDKRTNRCKKNDNNVHLGGHCNFAGNEVKKLFTNLPKHSFIRINAVYHMLDSWNGEYGYMKVDGVEKWKKKGESTDKGIDVCGGDSKDTAFNIKIDVVMEHTADEVEILFGSELVGDACKHSFAIDDVMIYTKE